MSVNWEHIRQVWVDGVEDLTNVANRYGVSVPEIAIKAKSEGWGDRGYHDPSLDFSGVEILDDKQVILAHKTDLGRLRLIAATSMESLQGSTDPILMLKMAEKLAKIYNIIIPLERKVFGIDADGDGSPDGIIINVGGNNGGK